jgi:hypothetical protein
LLESKGFGMHSDKASDQRLVLSNPVVADGLMVRQLVAEDVDLLADAASDVEFVKGRLKVPSSSDEARSMLAEWEDQRLSEQGTSSGSSIPMARD